MHEIQRIHQCKALLIIKYIPSKNNNNTIITTKTVTYKQQQQYT
jgi:hypothetical protein